MRYARRPFSSPCRQRRAGPARPLPAMATAVGTRIGNGMSAPIVPRTLARRIAASGGRTDGDGMKSAIGGSITDNWPKEGMIAVLRAKARELAR